MSRPGRRAAPAGDPRAGDRLVRLGEPRIVGPGFHAQVQALVRQIPAGALATYGQLATLLGSPRVARHVGWALAASGDASPPVPWHRVINAQGRISHRGDVARAELQARLLAREGLRADARGRYDLRAHGWHPELGWTDALAGPQ